MDIIERRKYREAVQEAVKEELYEHIDRIGRGDMTEARARTAVKHLIRLYGAEIGGPSDEDGGYTYAVSWLKSMLKDADFMQFLTERRR